MLEWLMATIVVGAMSLGSYYLFNETWTTHQYLIATSLYAIFIKLKD